MSEPESHQSSESDLNNPLFQDVLDLQRRNLLDIGKRNPLTNAPIRTFRRNQLLVVNELSDEIHRILYVEGKKFTFLPAKGISADAKSVEEAMDLVGDTFVPDELSGELHSSQTDTKLQTLLTPAALQKKLLFINREAKSIEEEQGVSVLFLALGFLKYFESESSGMERYAPLLLLPVELTRDSRKGAFRLSKRDLDLESNKSLAMMLLDDFQIVLPDLPEQESWKPTEYFKEVEAAVVSRPRWSVEANTMALSFFSFAKFLMYRDLELKNHSGDGLEGVGLVQGLLTGVNSSTEHSPKVSITAPDQQANLDVKFKNPKDLSHILDADSSQTQVIANAMEGKNLVVQGPPGTGKSQTIANVIAGAVNQGKKVLFIAEKRAALEVVMKRLVDCGLGPLCLELHSHKANKSHVYASLKETLELSRPVDVSEDHYRELQQLRDRLNLMSELVHSQDSITGNTAYRLMGRISQLSGKGIPPANFEIPDIDTWSIEQFDERRGLVSRFAEATMKFGSEHQHPWRGVEKRLSPVARQKLNQLLDDVSTSFLELRDRFQKAVGVTNVNSVLCKQGVIFQQEQLVQIQSMPKDVPELMGRELIAEHCAALLELCELIDSVNVAEAALDGTVISSAFESKWEHHLNSVTKEGSSFFRLFKSSYRNAVRELKTVCKSKLPGKPTERLELLGKLVQIEELHNKIGDRDVLGRECFGIQWQQSKTSYQSLYKSTTWIDQQSNFLGDIAAVREQIAKQDQSTDYADVRDQLEVAWNNWAATWDQVEDTTGLDNAKAFGQNDISALDLTDVNERTRLWAADPDQLGGYHELLSSGDLLSQNGLEEVRMQISSGKLACPTAEEVFTLLRSERVLNNILRNHPELESISGSERTTTVEKFKQKDEELRVLAAREVALKHFEGIPRGVRGTVGVVRGELVKKRRHMPIRKLLDTAGDVVAALKPVFLMSPLSVAQYLKPGGVTFDLLLIDEASQVKPQDALGAIFRARQIVVVGDQKQMPPTSFFDRQVSGDDESGIDEVVAGEDLDSSMQLAQQATDMESILALCDSRFENRVMLTWHYRSEHPSLIEGSNHEFYSSKLLYPPSAEFGSTTSGMSFVHVEDGVYERSKRRHNEKEAEVICDHILDHVHNHPNWTLGIVALSVSQRNLIQNRIEALCREHPHLERFCDENKSESFFVKNLENVQGDERDVVFVSIGYGKDANGYFGQSFGPVSQLGGERRLNVLFTRARKRCVIFASITHDDIRTDTVQHQGPRCLKRFMKYAATGDLDVPLATGEEMDSPFEEDVAGVLHEHGYVVHAQVGASGFKIDLAIVDPQNQNHYVLAIECDGARYHSSSWARERDRLRQQVLESKGWRFHRIWSTDWFYNREIEIQKLVRAIEEAKQFFGALRSSGTSSSAINDLESNDVSNASEEEESPLSPDGKATSSPIPRESSKSTAQEDRNSQRTIPYEESNIDVKGHLLTQEIHDLGPHTLIDAVVHIIEVESPVHVDVVAVRIASCWGKSRVGSRIRQTVVESINLAIKDGSIRPSETDGPDFYIHKNYSETDDVRNRANVELSKLKYPESIARSEIRKSILFAVQSNMSLTIDECHKEVQSILGTNLGRSKMREIVSDETIVLDRQGDITRSGETLGRAVEPGVP